MRYLKRNNGITLIALVITIIVLIILAGVAINMLSGDNGILGQASRAKQDSEKSEIIEQIRLDIMAKQAENEGNISGDDFYTILGNYGTISDDESVLKTYKGNYEILISDIFTDIERQSNNLINPENLRYGIRVNMNGEEENSEFISTELLEISENTNYTTNRAAQNITYYDSEKKAISYTNGENYSSITGFTTPINAKYMVISYRTNNTAIEGIWCGLSSDLVYENYGKINTKKGYPNKLVKEKIFYSTDFLDSNNYFIYNPNYITSIIKPIENRIFYITGLNSATIYYLNEDMNVIGKKSYTDLTYIESSFYENTKYLLINGTIDDKDNIKMEYYDVQDVLKSRIIVGYGDSMTAGSSQSTTTWLGKVSTYFDMVQYNRGIGGSAITENGATAWVTPDGEYLGREEAGDVEPTEEHLTINSGMCNDERINTIPTNADIVVFFGGANGFSGDTEEEMKTTYKLALDKIKNRAPNCKIVCVNIPYNQNDSAVFDTRRNVITSVAKEYNYPVVELKQLMGVDSSNCTTYMIDTIHWNEKGNVLIAEQIINAIEEAIASGYIS